MLKVGDRLVEWRSKRECRGFPCLRRAAVQDCHRRLRQGWVRVDDEKRDSIQGCGVAVEDKVRDTAAEADLRRYLCGDICARSGVKVREGTDPLKHDRGAVERERSLDERRVRFVIAPVEVSLHHRGSAGYLGLNGPADAVLPKSVRGVTALAREGRDIGWAWLQKSEGSLRVGGEIRDNNREKQNGQADFQHA